MSEYILHKNNLAQLFTRLLQTSPVYAPINNDGVVVFEPLEDVEQFSQEYQNTPVPPKKLLFPQTETLFCYADGETLQLDEPEEYQHAVIFGIRPCDARSFTMLDRVFEGPLPDVYYLQKRKKTILIGLACSNPCVTCFCSSVGGGPTDSEGLDLLLTDIGDEYFVERVSDKGKAMIDNGGELFEEASDAQRQKKIDIHAKAETLIRRTIQLEGIQKQLDSLFYHPVWSELAQECLGCSICTFLCPTCHCFDIQDETFGEQGQRVRVWDSCSNPEYTLHASGHNPRPGRMHRTRNRLYHKYDYFPQKYGEIACVGCGRCISKCPVNIDIIEMLTKIQRIQHDA